MCFRAIRFRGGFGFRAGVGEEPARESAGEAARNIGATRAACGARCGNGSAYVAGWAGCFLFDFALWFVIFRLNSGRRRSGRRLGAIFCERFARENDGFFDGVGWSGGAGETRSLGTAIVEAALLGTAWFESARLTAAILRTALIAATVFVATRFVAAGFAALRRSIFRRRKVASGGALRASTAMTPTTATETASTAIATAITTATVRATVVATAKVLAAAIATTAGARRVILRRIVLRRKILWRGSVRIRLALVFFGGVGFVVRFDVVLFRQLIARSGFFHDAGMLLVREGIVVGSIVFGRFFVRRFVMLFIEMNDVFAGFVVSAAGVGERFTGKQLDDVGRRGRVRRRGCCYLRIGMPVAVVVVLEIFENVADVEESIAIEAYIHERRLHAGEDAGDFAFIDAADESELFFALDINFD